MSLQELYQNLITKNDMSHDQAQILAIDALQKLTENLLHSKTSTWIDKFKSSQKPSIKGIYFYGRVGRGKTMLMDIFYQNLPIKKKKRIHFHRFMEDLHQQLSKASGQYNPLNYVARQWATDLDVLCFDEFFVADIADAMLISGVLTSLFNYGVVLVATSNSKPEMLYPNGLQRQRFIPTISLLNQYCDVISIDGDRDHRLAHFEEKLQYRDYFYPCDNENQLIRKLFIAHSEQDEIRRGSINIHGRSIGYLAQCTNIIWFDFYAICSGPRSQRDYIKIADHYSTVFISQVPKFSGKLIPAVFSGVEDSYQRSGVLLGDLRLLDDEARRFIALVDEFYDRKVRLILSAEVNITKLYQGEQLNFEFARCQSRLIEMQSTLYHDTNI